MVVLGDDEVVVDVVSFVPFIGAYAPLFPNEDDVVVVVVVISSFRFGSAEVSPPYLVETPLGSKPPTLAIPNATSAKIALTI